MSFLGRGKTMWAEGVATLATTPEQAREAAKLASLRTVMQGIDPTIEILKFSKDQKSVKVRLRNRSEGWLEVRTLFTIPPESVAPQRS